MGPPGRLLIYQIEMEIEHAGETAPFTAEVRPRLGGDPEGDGELVVDD